MRYNIDDPKISMDYLWIINGYLHGLSMVNLQTSTHSPIVCFFEYVALLQKNAKDLTIRIVRLDRCTSFRFHGCSFWHCRSKKSMSNKCSNKHLQCNKHMIGTSTKMSQRGGNRFRKGDSDICQKKGYELADKAIH